MMPKLSTFAVLLAMTGSVDAKVLAGKISSSVTLPSATFRIPSSKDVEATSKRLGVKRYATSKNSSPAIIEKKFAASGDFVCGRFFAQAQVTKKKNLITTAGHVVRAADCSDKDLTKCRFGIPVDGVMKEYRIKRLVASDYTCESGEPLEKGDWAVLELEQDVAVEPYTIDRAVTRAIGVKSTVTSVGRSQDIYKAGATGMNVTDYPRHYTDCHVSEIRTLWQGDDPEIFESNCGGYSFNSGGGLFKDQGEKSFLVGIMVRSNETTKKSTYIPVSGRLYSVLSSL